MAQTRQYKVANSSASSASLFLSSAVLLGEAGVGKTNLLTQFVKGEFIDGQESTIGVAFFAHQITLPDNTVVKLELWDTAGQERYSGLAPLYYRGSQAAVVVYDITSTKSFERAKQWVKELQGQTDLSITVGLAANKTDLEDQRKVSEKDGNAYANEHGLLFIETSAKTGRNIKELFIRIAQHLSTQPAPARKEAPLAVGGGPPQKSCCGS